LGFIALSLIATLLSDYRISALTHWFYLVGLFLLLSVFFDYFRVARANLMGLALLLNGLLFFSVASAFWLLLYHREAVNNSTFFGFANPRFINQVHVWLVLPMAYLAVRARRRNRRALLPLISVAMAFSIGFTLNGRGVTLALIA
ncbi:O-antigen ligase domain-containing protein, partial [Vibrio parahaemolyticus]|nr:O-antigen ligase domain-containing protein [Vibrio parahaemolyticus]